MEAASRICTMLFKMSVSQTQMMNIIAATNDIDKMTLDKLYIECVNEVRRTNGNFVLEDAFKWQKGSKWASKP